MTVARICTHNVETVSPDESVQAAAQRMNLHRVGTLVVVNDVMSPVGILTDRDLAMRMVGQRRDPIHTTVRQVMTPAPDTILTTTSIETALSLMRAGPYRRLPVVDENGQVVGLLSVDDILIALAREFHEIQELLLEEAPESLATVD